MTPTTTALTPTRARLVQDRVLAARGATRGSLTTLHLEDVRDHVRSLAQKQVRPRSWSRSN